MTNGEILRCFEHRPDGSWLCLARAAIETPDGRLEVEPGEVFRFGERHAGLDVAEYLEQLGAQFGS